MSHDKRVMLKNVTLLHTQAGRADAPGTGEPISIVTLAWREDIESLLLTMRDTKALAIGLLGVLGHHGDEQAQKILDVYTNNENDLGKAS